MLFSHRNRKAISYSLFARYLKDRNRLLANTVVRTNMRNTGLKSYVEAAGAKLEELESGS
jgi:phosphomannomutase